MAVFFNNSTAIRTIIENNAKSAGVIQAMARSDHYRWVSKWLNMIHPVHSWRHACAINMLASGKAVSDVKNHLGHENVESTMIYLHLDLKTKRQVLKKFIDYSQSTLKHDPKIDELIDWEHKKETLAWLDSL